MLKTFSREELMARMTAREFQEWMKEPHPPDPSTLCSCGKEIDEEAVEMNRKINKVQVCSDCYFDALGKELDEHPIRPLGTHRPGT